MTRKHKDDEKKIQSNVVNFEREMDSKQCTQALLITAVAAPAPMLLAFTKQTRSPTG
jgi:hypothetical protein